MPAVPSGKVLVSGANGFVATWVIKTLLEQGYSVRGTVRSQSKIPHLLKVFGSYRDKVEFVVVDDMTRAGAFDEHVKDVDAIEHTASPVHFMFEDPNEYIRPAVQGTVHILESALKYGSKVKRVVVTASVACVVTLGLPELRTFTENDWNEGSIKEVEEKGKAAHPMHKYCTSKTLAEKAAWEFVEKHQKEIEWDLVTIMPPHIFGPVIHEVHEPSALNASMDGWYRHVLKEVGREEPHTNQGGSWVDVRDVAEAHVLSLQNEAAGGNRFIVNSGLYKGRDFINIAHSLDPSVPKLEADDTGYKAENVMYDSTKSKEVLGLRYRTMEETTKDILDDFKAKGWF
ncbi:NAD(P)-binding protein [Panus rudis PR-1116 ss-1]|nr:NAD(P)-binding protein [Panus rudis PR-1116 ss-1]